MCRRSAPRAVLPAPLDAVELYTPDADRSVERSCGALEVAELTDVRRWERLAARSLPLLVPPEQPEKREAATPHALAARARETLLQGVLQLGVRAQMELPARRSQPREVPSRALSPAARPWSAGLPPPGARPQVSPPAAQQLVALVEARLLPSSA